MNSNFWDKAQNINPRILYVIALIVIAIPLLDHRLTLPITPNTQTKRAFDAIEKIGNAKPAKLAIIDGEWSASTRGENQFQEQAIMEHMMRLHIPFALLTFTPQNRVLSQRIADSLAKQYGYVYGRDYVNWGYKLAMPQTLKAMAQDIPGTLKEDANHQPLAGLPIMQGVKTYKDISLIVEVTPSSTLDTWLGLVQGVAHTPIVYAPTAVMAPEGYPFLDSGQIVGIVTGVAGAGDYEALLQEKGPATSVATALSSVYALIILLIVVGNLGYYASRAAKRKEVAQ
jgi:hypothetical protein